MEQGALRVRLTLHFQRNPDIEETILSAAQRSCVPVALVEMVLERMTEQSILERVGHGSDAVYRYRRPYVNKHVALNRGATDR